MMYTTRDLLQLKECDNFTQNLTDEALNKPLIGAIFWVDLNQKDIRGSVQSGIRPCLILNNYIEFDEMQTFPVVPLTTQLKKPNLPTHILIEPTLMNGLKDKSMTLIEQYRTIDSSFIKGPIGMIDYDNYIKIIKSVIKNLGVDYNLYEDQECPNDYNFQLIEKLLTDG